MATSKRQPHLEPVRPELCQTASHRLADLVRLLARHAAKEPSTPPTADTGFPTKGTPK